ncbi:hypothetical protein [Azospirillum largimobile]
MATQQRVHAVDQSGLDATLPVLDPDLVEHPHQIRILHRALHFESNLPFCALSPHDEKNTDQRCMPERTKGNDEVDFLARRLLTYLLKLSATKVS